MADSVCVAAVEAVEQGIAIGMKDGVFWQEAEHLSGEMMKIVTDLDTRCSNLSLEEGRGLGGIEERLHELQEKVLAWDSDQSMLWERDLDEASEFLRVVDEVRELTQSIGSLHFEEGGHHELLNRAHSILQTTMVRLEEEFIHLLVHYQEPVEPDYMSFRSSVEDSVDGYSYSSFDDESIEGRFPSEIRNQSKVCVIDLIHPDAVCHLKCIAEMMFLSNYEKECCQAYISVRKEALDQYLSVLHLERLSIEEILQLDWNVLRPKIKSWNRAIKVFIRVYLASERHLCDFVFGDLYKSLKGSCFVETSRASILQVLNLGVAIAIGPPKAERLYRILDMYEGLADLLTDVESLVSEEFGSSILAEFHEVLLRLGESVRAILSEFKSAIRTNTSTTPFAGGGNHPLTRYVMNYLKVLADHSETLNLLLKDQDEKVLYSLPEHESETSSFYESSPLAHLIRSATSLLESNLDARSMLYRDDSLQNIFVMNNIYYMIEKVKDSDVRTFVGDDWIKENRRKFLKHATNYERASWTSVLSYLKDEGICNTSSSTPSKTVLKERFRNFNLAFEEVYRTQTAWLVPAIPLRDDLRISISLKVLQAYRTFMGRYASHLDGVRHRDNFIKYSADDLGNFLLDLFEGSPKSLHYSRRW